MRTFAILGLMLACGSAAVDAAPTKKAPPLVEPSMQVHVVRSAHPGCEPQCLQWIAAQGKIDEASVGQFKKALSQLGGRKLPILIDSSGGSVNSALAIGRLLRAKGLDVVVTKTVFTPCAPSDTACRRAKSGGELRGLAEARMSKCASSCAFILAGGSRRFVGHGTFVGVHQITMIVRMYRILTRHSFGVPIETRKTLLSEQKVGQKNPQTQSTYGSMKHYFAEMGIGDEIMPLILSTPGDRIRWLTQDELKSTRLATHSINGEQLITGVAGSTPGPAAAPSSLGSPGVCKKLGEWTIGCDPKATPPAPTLPASAPHVPSADLQPQAAEPAK
jgi:hypothetical protein